MSTFKLKKQKKMFLVSQFYIPRFSWQPNTKIKSTNYFINIYIYIYIPITFSYFLPFSYPFMATKNKSTNQIKKFKRKFGHKSKQTQIAISHFIFKRQKLDLKLQTQQICFHL